MPGRRPVENFIHNENIKIFWRALESCTDHNQRSVLLMLLRAELAERRNQAGIPLLA